MQLYFHEPFVSFLNWKQNKNNTNNNKQAYKQTNKQNKLKAKNIPMDYVYEITP